MGKEFKSNLSFDPRKANKFGFSPALLIQVQKYVPTGVIQAIGKWSAGEQRLTEGILKLLLNHYTNIEYTPTNLIFNQQEVEWFETKFVPSVIVAKWQTIPELEVLKDKAVALLNNDRVEPFWLLKEYQKILQKKITPLTKSPEQKELLALELVALEKDNLKISNLLYETVFNNDWLEAELKYLSPYKLTLDKLAAKSNSATRVLEEILYWTNGDLFLTKIICDLVCKSSGYIKNKEAAIIVKNLVRRHLIKNWEKGLAAEYLKPIRDLLLTPNRAGDFRYLKLYRKVSLAQRTTNYNKEQKELIEAGLLKIEKGILVVFNQIYSEIFDLDWVEEELIKNTIELSSLNDDSDREERAFSLPSKKRLITYLLLTASLGIGFIFYNKIANISPDSLPKNENFKVKKSHE